MTACGNFADHTEATPEGLIADSHIAAVVSDPRQPDNPIVACNQAFMDLTGYRREEILGRNCRFLRGPASEVAATDALRAAIQARRPALVELTNYRKDGSTFLNAVMIAPLFDEAGEVAYFLGSQMAVEEAAPARKEAAREAISRLSPRQQQILAAISAGRLNKQIAWDLSLSERTVKMDRAAMLTRLGVRSNAEAIRIAILAGL